jgi:hypothetical protein
MEETPQQSADRRNELAALSALFGIWFGRTGGD